MLYAKRKKKFINGVVIFMAFMAVVSYYSGSRGTLPVGGIIGLFAWSFLLLVWVIYNKVKKKKVPEIIRREARENKKYLCKLWQDSIMGENMTKYFGALTIVCFFALFNSVYPSENGKINIIFKESILSGKTADEIRELQKSGECESVVSRWDHSAFPYPDIVKKGILLEVSAEDIAKITAIEKDPYIFEITIYLSQSKSLELQKLTENMIGKEMAIFINDDYLLSMPVYNKIPLDKNGFVPILLGSEYLEFIDIEEVIYFMNFYKLKAEYRELSDSEREKIKQKISTLSEQIKDEIPREMFKKKIKEIENREKIHKQK